MIEAFLFALFFLYAAYVLAKGFMPSIFLLCIRMFRTIPKVLIWLLYGTARWPTNADRRKRKGAQRFVPKR